MRQLEIGLLAANVLIYTLLTVYSYSFVDLNLTLSQNTAILSFIESMQYLGYYNRPLSSLIYILLILTAFSFFIINIYLINKRKLSTKYIFLSTVFNFLILIPAYPFLSSDIFNYMFDAKIIVNYHLSPYSFRAQDFPNDEWVRFMRWIHRYSPYGPLWLGFSIVPYVLGFGKFIITLFSFKIFIGVFHLINTLLIYKILNIAYTSRAASAAALYSLNPLFLIEGLANSHNDVVLATMLILPIYLLVKNKKVLSILSVVGGFFIKYIPILILPWIFWGSASKKGINVFRVIYLNLITMAIFTILFSNFRITVPIVSSGATQIQFQPWYLFWTLPFIFLTGNLRLTAIAIALSFGAALRYLPFIYYGDWSQPYTLEFMKIATLLPPLVISLYLLRFKLVNLQ